MIEVLDDLLDPGFHPENGVAGIGYERIEVRHSVIDDRRLDAMKGFRDLVEQYPSVEEIFDISGDTELEVLEPLSSILGEFLAVVRFVIEQPVEDAREK